MFSKYMLLVLGIAVQNGHYTGCLPYEWDFKTNTIKVSKSRIPVILYYISLAYTVIGSTVLFVSYAFYLQKTGFHIRDLRNTFQFFVVCVLSVLCVCQYLIFKRMATVSRTINMAVFFFKSIPEKYSIKSSSWNLMVFVYGAVILAEMTVPQSFAFLCFMKNNLHPFYYASTLIFSEETIRSGFFQAWAAFSILWIGNLFYSTVLIGFCPSFIFWFYGLELSQTLKKNDTFTFQRSTELIQILKGLELLKFRIQECNGPTTLPGSLGFALGIYLMSFAAIVKSDLDLLVMLAFIVVIGLYLLLYASYKVSYLSMENYLNIVHESSSTMTKLRKMEILACTTVVLDWGPFGLLDRSMFIFMGDLIFGNTINVLLM